jgi:hypothetical protein
MMRTDYKESNRTDDADEIVVEGLDEISRRVGFRGLRLRKLW